MPTKPKRKRVSRKQKLNADMTYMVFNSLIPDIGALASANATYELLNGRLSTPDGDGHDASRDKSALLVGLIGYGALPTEQFSMRQTFPCTLTTEEIYARCGAAIRAFPSGTMEEEGGGLVSLDPPTTIGVMAMWQKPDGTSWTVFYHHPRVTPGQAAALLKLIVADFEKDDAEAAAGSADSNGSDN